MHSYPHYNYWQKKDNTDEHTEIWALYIYLWQDFSVWYILLHKLYSSRMTPDGISIVYCQAHSSSSYAGQACARGLVQKTGFKSVAQKDRVCGILCDVIS